MRRTRKEICIALPTEPKNKLLTTSYDTK
jgi:hypothetical protein